MIFCYGILEKIIKLCMNVYTAYNYACLSIDCVFNSVLCVHAARKVKVHNDFNVCTLSLN